MKDTRVKRLARGAAAATVAGALLVGGASAALAAPGPGPRGPMSNSNVTGGPLASLIAAGTITSADATAVSTALRAAHEAGRATIAETHRAEHKAVLDSLVAKGTITQAQADAIIKADRGGMRTLVNNGTISQAQVDAIRGAMAATRDQARTARDAQRASETSTVLAKLVSDGTLTQAKAAAISAALAERPAHQGPGRGMGKGGFGR